MGNIKLFSVFFGLIIILQIIAIYQLMVVVDNSALSLELSERTAIRVLTLNEKQQDIKESISSETDSLENMIVFDIENKLDYLTNLSLKLDKISEEKVASEDILELKNMLNELLEDKNSTCEK